MKSIPRKSLIGLLASLCLLALVGCVQHMETRAYLLDVRETETTPEIRLLAIELTGSAPKSEEYLADALAIPAAAAKLPDQSAGAVPGRRIFRLETNGEELVIDELQQEDLMLVMASPRAEVAADLKLLAYINAGKMQEQAKKESIASSGAMGGEASGALAELTSDENVARLREAADADARLANLRDIREQKMAEAAEAEKSLEVNREKYRALLEEFDRTQGDVEETKHLRHQIALLDQEIAKAEAENPADSIQDIDSQIDEASQATLTGEELHRLIQLVDKSLEVTE